MAKRLVEMTAVMAVWICAVFFLPDDLSSAAACLTAQAVLLAITIADVLVFRLLFRDHIRIPFPGNIRKGRYVGFLAGAGMIFASIGLLAVSGVLHIYQINRVPDFWMWFIAAAMNACTYVFLLDGYLYAVLKELAGRYAAMAAVSLLYTLFHAGSFEMGAISVLNSMLMNLSLLEMLDFTDSLLTPMSALTMWDWIGGLIFGGIYCMRGCPSLFNASYEGSPDLIEGSMSVMIVLLAVFVLSAWLCSRKDHPQNWADAQK